MKPGQQILWSKKIGVFFLALFFVSSMLEIGLRWFTSSQNKILEKDSYIGQRYGKSLDLDIDSENNTGARTHLKTNSIGFIGPEWSKKKDGFRIANLGDSFAAGIGVDYDKNYSALLPAALAKEKIIALESQNFGISGQGTGHALATWRYYAQKFDPDLVILWFYLGNDFRNNLEYSEMYEKSSAIKRVARKSEFLYFTVTRLAKISWIADLMKGKILTRVGTGVKDHPTELPLDLRLVFTNDKENKPALEKTEKYLNSLKKEVGDRPLVVAMIPPNFQADPKILEVLRSQYPSLKNNDLGFNLERPNEKLIEILKIQGIDFLDFTPLFREQCQDFCDLYACPHCHLSEKGHRLVAEKTAKFLIKYLK